MTLSIKHLIYIIRLFYFKGILINTVHRFSIISILNIPSYLSIAFFILVIPKPEWPDLVLLTTLPDNLKINFISDF